MSSMKKMTGVALAAAAATMFAMAPVSTVLAEDAKVKCMSNECKGQLIDAKGHSLNNSCKGDKNAVEVDTADTCTAHKGVVVKAGAY